MDMKAKKVMQVPKVFEFKSLTELMNQRIQKGRIVASQDDITNIN